MSHNFKDYYSAQCANHAVDLVNDDLFHAIDTARGSALNKLASLYRLKRRKYRYGPEKDYELRRRLLQYLWNMKHAA